MKTREAIAAVIGDIVKTKMKIKSAPIEDKPLLKHILKRKQNVLAEMTALLDAGHEELESTSYWD